MSSPQADGLLSPPRDDNETQFSVHHMPSVSPMNSEDRTPGPTRRLGSAPNRGAPIHIDPFVAVGASNKTPVSQRAGTGGAHAKWMLNGPALSTIRKPAKHGEQTPRSAATGIHSTAISGLSVGGRHGGATEAALKKELARQRLVSDRARFRAARDAEVMEFAQRQREIEKQVKEQRKRELEERVAAAAAAAAKRHPQQGRADGGGGFEARLRAEADFHPQAGSSSAQRRDRQLAATDLESYFTAPAFNKTLRVLGDTIVGVPFSANQKLFDAPLVSTNRANVDVEDAERCAIGFRRAQQNYL